MLIADIPMMLIDNMPILSVELTSEAQAVMGVRRRTRRRTAVVVGSTTAAATASAEASQQQAAAAEQQAARSTTGCPYSGNFWSTDWYCSTGIAYRLHRSHSRWSSI